MVVDFAVRAEELILGLTMVVEFFFLVKSNKTIHSNRKKWKVENFMSNILFCLIALDHQWGISKLMPL